MPPVVVLVKSVVTDLNPSVVLTAMANYIRNEEDARALSLSIQMIAWIFIFRVMLLAKQHWQGVRSYQALSDHPSLPLEVQESQHMMMIAVCPII